MCFGAALVIVVMGLFAPSAARAAETPWVEKKPARYRLVAAEIDGQAFAALQVDMKPGWHTYWRFPGASGIAPEFDFAKSSGVEVGETQFPAPYFFDDGVGGFYGYQGMAGFVFPLSLKDKTQLQLSGLIGVCREVCVPMDIELKLPLADMAATDHAPFIEGLLAARPQAASKALNIARASFDGVSIQLVVTGTDLKSPQAMYIPGPHDVLGEPHIAARHAAAFLIEIPAWSKLDHPLIGRKLTFIVRDGSRVVEQEVVVVDHRSVPRDSNFSEP